MQRGINWMLNAIRPTLGPLPGIVALERNSSRNEAPELMDNAALTARRVIELADRDADMGAMLLRGMLWRVHQSAGDGSATAAVLFGSVYNEALRYITAGGNAMQLRRHLDRGMRVVLEGLTAMSKPVEGQARLTEVAQAICYDPPLAHMLGEIFDIIGEYGQFEMREGRTRDLEREYVEGVYWDGGLLAREMIVDIAKQRADLENPAILLTNCDIEEPRQLIPTLDAAIQAGIGSLMIIARSLSPVVVSLLVASQTRTRIKSIAVKMPFTYGIPEAAMMQDLQLLIGGRPVIKDAGDTLEAVTLADLGRARRVWGDRNYFGIVGGQGDARALRAHLAQLRSAYAQMRDPDERDLLRRRIGKLMGGSAILWVGAASESEVKFRKEVAERTAQALRGAILEGALPGGGIAFLACQPRLRTMLQGSTDPDARAAYSILLRALDEPARTIIHNAGYNPDEIMVEIKHAAPGCGFDVRTGQVTDMLEAGILDATGATKEAWHTAVSSAAMALTVDVLVHKKLPEQAIVPE
jgi:chaperonin GroEL